MTDIYNKLELREKRKLLRNNQTNAEQVLWRSLRGKQILNLKFRRQFSFGYYIVDFYCKDKKLVIEVDGDTHASDTAILYDNDRTIFLNNLGIKVIRFTNDDIYNNVDNVLSRVIQILSDPS